MPDVGRFFNIDVLAEDYDYQTPYAFSENKVINHIELEGLEGVLIGPGGVPLPPPPPAYGSRTTGLHPVGQRPVRLSDVTDAVDSAVRGVTKAAAETTMLAINSAVITYVNVTSLWDNVMNSESDKKGDDKGDSKKQKETGSYTNKHKSGKQYHGKGDKKRSEKSGKEKAEKNNDPVEETDWTPSKNDREAFKDESRRMEQDKVGDTPGHKNPNNYNKRRSPGDKYRQQDGD